MERAGTRSQPPLAPGPRNGVTGGAWSVLVFQAADTWILHVYILYGCIPPKAQRGSVGLRLSSKLNDTELCSFTFQRV